MTQTHILLAGVSGLPGQNIAKSLQHLCAENNDDFKVTVLKRQATSHGQTPSPDSGDPHFETAYISSYTEKADLVHTISTIRPDIVVSALKAEPAPELDNLLVSAIVEYLDRPEEPRKPIVFINGYTLDLLDLSVSACLEDDALIAIQPKIDFAKRLTQVSDDQPLFKYTTIVNASFLDYTLMEGYNRIDVIGRKATLWDDGAKMLTGCSLDFIGEVVVKVIRMHVSSSTDEKQEVVNKRIRVAETVYSGRTLLETVERITGEKFEVVSEGVEQAWESKQMHVISYLNWSKKSQAADLAVDGLQFGVTGDFQINRRSLEQICAKAIQDGPSAFEGIGRPS